MNKWALGTAASVGTALVLSLVMWFLGAFSDGQSAISDAHIREIANEEIDAAGIVSPADVAANTESITDLEKTQDKLDSKIERIVDILLEP